MKVFRPIRRGSRFFSTSKDPQRCRLQQGRERDKVYVHLVLPRSSLARIHYERHEATLQKHEHQCPHEERHRAFWG